MSRFTASLGLRGLEYSTGLPVTRGDVCLWYLPEPLPWELGALGSGAFLIVPAFNPAGWCDEALAALAAGELRARGVTDLGSVPPIGRPLVAPNGREAKAFVLHDDGYVTKGWGGRYDRAGVDGLLLEACAALGSPWPKRTAIHRVVRTFGGRGWGR